VSGASTAAPLAVVGCDFRVASSSWRSRLVLSDDEGRTLGETLRSSGAADGFVDLNTCNRTEWIVSTKDPRWAASLLSGQMVQRMGAEAAAWFSPYTRLGDEAAVHVFKLVLGQHSLVVGERQIAGQLYGALDAARDRGCSSRVLNGLGTAAGRLVRMALKQGRLGGRSVGVHSLAVARLARWLGPGVEARVAVVGLGQIGRKVHSLLEREKLYHVVGLNRTIGPDSPRGARPLSDLPSVLSEVDAVILCTGAPRPVLTAAHAARRSPSRPLLVVDVGIPEQGERSGMPAGVTVCGLDELVTFHRETVPAQEEPPSGGLDPLIEAALVEFRSFCGQPAFSDIIDTVHRTHVRLVREEIPRIIAERLDSLPEEVRVRVEQELRAAILLSTSDMFRTIRAAAGKNGEEPWQGEF
jgi:glutamyl-tRNA reductase